MTYAAFDLTGKVALVTGGNGGIGLAMATALAQAGARIAIWGSNPDKTCAAERQLADAGHDVLAARVDVSQEDEVAAGMAAVVARFGRVDSVFANAAIGGGGALATMPLSLFRSVAAVNADGVFLTLREAARHMIARAEAGDPGGSLVTVSSPAATQGAPYNHAYAASKGAALSLMKSVVLELAPYGVRSNAILPGWTATDMTAGAQESKLFAERIIPRVPLKRWARPEEFGGIAVYLASDASSYHNGDAFVIDGGWALS